MKISEFISQLTKEKEKLGDIDVVIMTEFSTEGRKKPTLQGGWVRVKRDSNRKLDTVRGVWSPHLHRSEEKGEEVLYLW